MLPMAGGSVASVAPLPGGSLTRCKSECCGGLRPSRSLYLQISMLEFASSLVAQSHCFALHQRMLCTGEHAACPKSQAHSPTKIWAALSSGAASAAAVSAPLWAVAAAPAPLPAAAAITALVPLPIAAAHVEFPSQLCKFLML
jgi:hypothetical protein